VAADATNINFGALLPGDGTAWFDELTVELDGKPYVNTGAFDLDFESRSPVGFYTGGNGYRVELDNVVFHSGKQSLRMTYGGPPPVDPKAVDPKVAASTWKDVVAHLEGAREVYAKKEIKAREIEWAVQNARVVVQCMQTRSNEVSRDRSMAENIKWILEQSPNAKIVLWAHNGHVSTGGMGSYESMGASLRKMFGSQMVVFGFAFNEGSFQARSQATRILKDFTVPPAPAGSLDATLSAAKIPLFALDLRQAPPSGPVAAWLAEAHKTRSIGALYPEDQPYAFMADLKLPQSFDVVLFVEKPTAARKN
jgi:erythromycin esterase